MPEGGIDNDRSVWMAARKYETPLIRFTPQHGTHERIYTDGLTWCVLRESYDDTSGDAPDHMTHGGAWGQAPPSAPLREAGGRCNAEDHSDATRLHEFALALP